MKPHIRYIGCIWICDMPDTPDKHGLNGYVGTTPARAYAFWFEAVGIWIRAAEELRIACKGLLP